MGSSSLTRDGSYTSSSAGVGRRSFYFYSYFIPVLSVFALGGAGCPLLFPSCGEGVGGAGLTLWLWLPGLLRAVASLVAEHRLGSSQALERRLSRRGAWDLVAQRHVGSS